MMCPECGENTKVLESRIDVDGVYRRRRCPSCDHTFYTAETITDSEAFNGTRKSVKRN